MHMLEAVGHPYAVNPDRELRGRRRPRLAGARVHRPVALRSRMRLPQNGPTLAALALGTAAAVGGAAYLRRGVESRQHGCAGPR